MPDRAGVVFFATSAGMSMRSAALKASRSITGAFFSAGASGTSAGCRASPGGNQSAAAVEGMQSRSATVGIASALPRVGIVFIIDLHPSGDRVGGSYDPEYSRWNPPVCRILCAEAGVYYALATALVGRSVLMGEVPLPIGERPLDVVVRIGAFVARRPVTHLQVHDVFRGLVHQVVAVAGARLEAGAHSG